LTANLPDKRLWAGGCINIALILRRVLIAGYRGDSAFVMQARIVGTERRKKNIFFVIEVDDRPLSLVGTSRAPEAEESGRGVSWLISRPQVRGSEGAPAWRVLRRYSEFETLRRAIEADRNLALSLPQKSLKGAACVPLLFSAAAVVVSHKRERRDSPTP